MIAETLREDLHAARLERDAAQRECAELASELTEMRWHNARMDETWIESRRALATARLERDLLAAP